MQAQIVADLRRAHVRVKEEWVAARMTALTSSLSSPAASADKLFGAFLDTDLAETSHPVLPNDLGQVHTSPTWVLQCSEVVDVSVSIEARFTKARVVKHSTTLKLNLTDGHSFVAGLMARPSPAVFAAPPGAKLLIHNAPVRHGMLVLDDSNTAVLGGCVAELVNLSNHISRVINEQGLRAYLELMVPDDENPQQPPQPQQQPQQPAAQQQQPAPKPPQLRQPQQPQPPQQQRQRQPPQQSQPPPPQQPQQRQPPPQPQQQRQQHQEQPAAPQRARSRLQVSRSNPQPSQQQQQPSSPEGAPESGLEVTYIAQAIQNARSCRQFRTWGRCCEIVSRPTPTQPIEMRVQDGTGGLVVRLSDRLTQEVVVPVLGMSSEELALTMKNSPEQKHKLKARLRALAPELIAIHGLLTIRLLDGDVHELVAVQTHVDPQHLRAFAQSVEEGMVGLPL